MTSPLLDLFLPTVGSAPERPLVERHGRVECTYGSTFDHVRSLAGALQARAVEPGDRVSVQLDKSPDVLHLYLATLWAGAVFHPMNPALSADEAAFLVDDAQPALIIRSVDALGKLEADAARAAPMEEPVARSANDLAALLYTSGTTGRPKGAMITHGNLASNAEALVSAWGLRASDVLLHVLPLFHAHGLFVACNTALAAGMTIVWQDRFDPEAVAKLLDARSGNGARPTVVMGVPTHYTRLLATPTFDRDVAGGLRLCISGSAPLPASVHAEFAARTGHAILERYGMTETQMIASNPLDGARIPGTVGFALPGVQVRVTGDDGIARSDGGPGGVEVRGPNVCAGYWGAPDRWAAEITDDEWFRTGDLGRLGPDGRLTLVGRAKDLIISGGENVYPAEVERVIDELPGVAESAVVGMADPDFGELGLAVVVPDRSGPPVEPETVRDAVRGELAAFKVPRQVVMADELPRNAMGKVQKVELKRRYRSAWDASLR